MPRRALPRRFAATPPLKARPTDLNFGPTSGTDLSNPGIASLRVYRDVLNAGCADKSAVQPK
jgi:hypothetical protein